jgi:hypothetical protein
MSAFHDDMVALQGNWATSVSPPQRPRQFFAQLVDQQPDLRQQAAALRIDGPDRLLLRAERIEERGERNSISSSSRT